MSRGISERDATENSVVAFLNQSTKKPPIEHSVEINRLINYEMEGSIG